MHELGITQRIVEICSEAAAGAQVTRVTVEIGRLCGVLPDAVRFCYEVCAKGTVLEGSVLDIVSTPGSGTCRDCGAQMPVDDFLALCSCGSADIDCRGGDELRITEMEVI